MYLIKCENTSELKLEEFFNDDVPRYAILSHTWGARGTEVTFTDMMEGRGIDKLGYQKIRFCAEQARRDGLGYFWIDTCCIDKANLTELSEAIISMFRWYRNAATCYAYLCDVSQPDRYNFPREDFMKSRWFTRGWTLQELLAPASVEFFTKEGKRIGTKRSLEGEICLVTRIPVRALRGSHLSTFSIDERKSWANGRKTTREEDKAYSLLGIFGVHMPPLYGERESNAFSRLQKEIEGNQKGISPENFLMPPSLPGFSGTEGFVSRQRELEDIFRVLSGDGGDSGRRTVVLHGIRGIGKTQLALAYANRHKDNYSAIFWLNAEDGDSLNNSFASMARQILRNHPRFALNEKDNLNDTVNAVREWLSLPNNTQWLLVFDGYDNPNSKAGNISKFFPEASQGSVIVTTQSSHVLAGPSIEIQKLKDIHKCLEILSNTSRRRLVTDDPDAIWLAKELDGLPIALAAAGAYLNQVQISISDYLNLYKASWLRLYKTNTSPLPDEDRMLYSILQISFQHIEKQNELSAKILRLWAYLDNQDLWFELLFHSSSDILYDQLCKRKLPDDEQSFHRAMRLLLDYRLADIGLVSAEERIESLGFSMHGYVHQWMTRIIEDKWDQGLATLSFQRVSSHVPARESNGWWLAQRRLLRHAAMCSSYTKRGIQYGIDSNMALHKLGNLYSDQGKLKEAEEIFQQALQGYENTLGPGHNSAIDTVYELGLVYQRQGKLEEAKRMYQHALQGYEKTLGSDHISTLNTVHCLGLVYRKQDKLEEAVRMYQRALQCYEKTLSSDHESTLDAVYNLGLIYEKQNKLEGAVGMFQQALRGYEKTLGPDDSLTLDTASQLGHVYKKQGQLEEAEQIFQRALKGYEKTLGSDHKSTLDTACSLGLVYKKHDKLEKAERMCQRALQGYEETLGPDHNSTHTTAQNLGLVYRKQGKLEKAEWMCQRALQGYEKTLGLDHNSTNTTAHNLGLVYDDQGKLEAAEMMFQQALQGHGKTLGPDHKSTLETTCCLGHVYNDQNKLEEAEAMYQQALEGYEKTLGSDHKSTLDAACSLGLVHKKQGKLLEKAGRMYQAGRVAEGPRRRVRFEGAARSSTGTAAPIPLVLRRR